MTCAFSPRSSAATMPGTYGLFEITTAISAFGIRPAAMESAIARKFDPRPESRRPSFAFRVSGFKWNSLIHHRDAEAQRTSKNYDKRAALDYWIIVLDSGRPLHSE